MNPIETQPGKGFDFKKALLKYTTYFQAALLTAWGWWELQPSDWKDGLYEAWPALRVAMPIISFGVFFLLSAKRQQSIPTAGPDQR